MRRTIAFAIIMCSILAWPQPAAALHLIRQTRAVTTSGDQILTDGVNADMYVYPKPAGLDADKVCSIYGGLDNGDFLETGYFWRTTYSPSSPMCFNHRYISSIDTHYETEWWGGYTPGTYVDWTLEKVPSTTTWRVVVAGTLKGTWTSLGYGSVRAVVAGERYSYSYHNLGSWKYLTYRGWNSSTWYYWPARENLYYPAPPNNGNPANDPDYWFNDVDFGSPYHWLKLSYQGG